MFGSFKNERIEKMRENRKWNLETDASGEFLFEREAREKAEMLSKINSDEYKKEIVQKLIENYRKSGVTRDDPYHNALYAAMIEDRRNKRDTSTESAFNKMYKGYHLDPVDEIEARKRYIEMEETVNFNKFIASNPNAQSYRGIRIKEKKKEEYEPLQPVYYSGFWDGAKKIVEAVTVEKEITRPKGQWTGGMSQQEFEQKQNNIVDLGLNYEIVESKTQKEPSVFEVLKGVFKW